ncbi:MAG TPA: DUF4249 family protein [Longimicrobium sp.]|jgi:hypothetical protein|uniref:DUF4249 family protein n=1 Tax=Longimicrobium sp. TaxID=2029185 RepID=UPI002EDA76D5
MRWPIAGLCVLALTGCTIADVTTPPGQDRLVVQGVLRTDRTLQALILYRSVAASEAPPERGAQVVVTRDDGARFVFNEVSNAACIPDVPSNPGGTLGTCYATPAPLGFWVLPGRTYDLEVTTTRGEVARGRTQVPGAFSLVGLPFDARERANGVPGEQCRLPSGTVVPVTWTRSSGAWGYISPLLIFGLSAHAQSGGFTPPADPLELVGVSVSSSDTTTLLPDEFGVFDRFNLDQDLLRFLQGGLPNGLNLVLTISAADRNYINGVRGGSFNPSGQVRVSSVVGDGVGVFGSLVPLTARMTVGGSAAVPLCKGG